MKQPQKLLHRLNTSGYDRETALWIHSLMAEVARDRNRMARALRILRGSYTSRVGLVAAAITALRGGR